MLNFTSGYMFIFCLHFMLTSFLLISTKYLVNLFIYLTFLGESFYANPAFQVRYIYNARHAKIVLEEL